MTTMVSISDIQELVHDLMNDIAIIDGNARLAMMKDQPSANMGKRLTQIRNAVTRMQQYCKNVLHSAMEPKINLIECLEKNIDEIKRDYPDTIIKLNIADNHSFEKAVIKNSDFFRVVNNIIKNAVEAKSKCVSVNVSYEFIAFKDDGEGFDNNVLSGKVKTTKEDGHGIGLESIRKICSKNNLNLDLKKSLNGSTVLLKLRK